MDLIEEEDLTPPEATQERDDLVGLSEPPRQDLLDLRSALTGEEPGDRRLSDAGRTLWSPRKIRRGRLLP